MKQLSFKSSFCGKCKGEIMRIVPLILSLTILLNADYSIQPIPVDFKYDKEKAILGKKLFHDARLSKDNSVSCSSCHMLQDGGDDNLQFSFGINGQLGNINSPTVLNSRYNLAQFWDGRTKDLKEQAAAPIANPIEMGSSISEVLKKIKKDSKYKKEFKKLYENGLTEENILDAIAEFEKALVTPNSRFDKYLRGETTALTKIEIEGYELFKSNGCISCHNGVNIGSNLYQKVGILKTYIDEFNTLGRYNVTKKKRDKYYFKVPTLRNIELTAPYLHDGSKLNLIEIVKFMMIYQLGIIPDEKDILKIVAFLKTLTGETPKILD